MIVQRRLKELGGIAIVMTLTSMVYIMADNKLMELAGMPLEGFDIR